MGYIVYIVMVWFNLFCFNWRLIDKDSVVG